MQYRKFGRLDWQTSVLGFGCMRLPTIPSDPEKIDEARAREMLRYGIDMGINYIDTAYPYHQGQSEPFVGRALQDGYRQKIRLATKMPVWLVKTASDFDKYLGEQLERLQTEHIDFYLLHALNAKRWEQLRSLDVMSWAEQAIASGRIGAIGFSFHDDYPAFDRILNDYDRWDFCQIQYNYMDIEEQAGLQGLKDAAEKGIPVVIMEPLRGGSLSNPPKQVMDHFRQVDPERTPTDWALQWLWDQPEVTLALSGMSSMEHVRENIESAQKARTFSLSSQERVTIDLVRETFRQLRPIACTNCGYCLPCPNGVQIPKNFEIFNKGVMFDNWGTARFHYGQLSAEEQAENCIDCRACEEVCPQHLQIADWLSYVQSVLGHEEIYDGRRLPLN